MKTIDITLSVEIVEFTHGTGTELDPYGFSGAKGGRKSALYNILQLSLWGEERTRYFKVNETTYLVHPYEGVKVLRYGADWEPDPIATAFWHILLFSALGQ